MSEPRPWHHRPCHIWVRDSFYIITAGTLHKRHIFRGNPRLSLLRDALFEIFAAHGWQLQAWALFSNHYHVIARSPQEGHNTLRPVIQRLHSQTAREVNRFDRAPGRRVWFQYRDTCLTHEASYYARLNYVHHNPVKHGLVPVAENYPFCSANWFRFESDPTFRRKVESFRHDQITIPDGFPTEDESSHNEDEPNATGCSSANSET